MNSTLAARSKSLQPSSIFKDDLLNSKKSRKGNNPLIRVVPLPLKPQSQSKKGSNKLNRSLLNNTTLVTNIKRCFTSSPKADERAENLSSQPPILDLISKCEEGLAHNHPPELCEEGVNGTYFLKNREGDTIAIFKPQDEEGMSLLNPKRDLLVKSADSIPSKKYGHYYMEEEEYPPAAQDVDCIKPLAKSDETCKSHHGVLPGEQSLREVAAFLLDRERFFGVPITVLAKVNYSPATVSSQPFVKLGSIQAFVENDGSAEDVGFNAFPVNEVHKIGILDIQIINTDRHEGNILFRRRSNSKNALIPIDHGYSLPHSLEQAWFCWLTWPQAKEPFSEEVKQYIQRIPIDQDVEMLRSQLGITEDCLLNMRISTTLLKKAAARNLTLYDIGVMICRVAGLEEPSELEIMVQAAHDLCAKYPSLPASHPTTNSSSGLAGDPSNAGERMNSNLFFYHLNQLLDKKISEILLKKQNAAHSKTKKQSLLRNAQNGALKKAAGGASFLRNLPAIETIEEDKGLVLTALLSPRIRRAVTPNKQFTGSRPRMAPIKINV